MLCRWQFTQTRVEEKSNKARFAASGSLPQSQTIQEILCPAKDLSRSENRVKAC